MFLSASRFPTHTDVLTEHGNPTLSALRLLLTVHPVVYMHAHAAFVQVRLHALSNSDSLKENIMRDCSKEQSLFLCGHGPLL